MGGMVVLASAASFHQQQHHEATFMSPSSAADPNPVIPLLAAAPCIVDEAEQRAKAAAEGGIHLWQPGAQPAAAAHHFHSHLPPNPNPNPNHSSLSDYLRKPVPTLLDAGGIIAGCGASAGGGTPTCQDCGNQAKKDCSHRRCRTCCKSRGFECSTHVKSTWVPAARRRERQLTSAAAVSAPKKPRLVSSLLETAGSDTSNSNATPSRSLDTTTNSSHQDASIRESLPRHVRAPAMFKCVRVTSIDDGEGEFAYHAMVKIGGRVFKGFLYGQGLDDDDSGGSAGDKDHAVPNISALHLSTQNGAASSSAVLPSDLFGGATHHYGNQIS